VGLSEKPVHHSQRWAQQIAGGNILY